MPKHLLQVLGAASLALFLSSAAQAKAPEKTPDISGSYDLEPFGNKANLQPGCIEHWHLDHNGRFLAESGRAQLLGQWRVTGQGHTLSLEWTHQASNSLPDCWGRIADSPVPDSTTTFYITAGKDLGLITPDGVAPNGGVLYKLKAIAYKVADNRKLDSVLVIDLPAVQQTRLPRPVMYDRCSNCTSLTDEQKLGPARQISQESSKQTTVNPSQSEAQTPLTPKADTAAYPPQTYFDLTTLSAADQAAFTKALLAAIGDRVNATYPPRAQDNGIEGWGDVDCRWTLNGSLADCARAGEQPLGYGFGHAATVLLSGLSTQPLPGAHAGSWSRLRLVWHLMPAE